MKTKFTLSTVIFLLIIFSISCTKKESTNITPVANFTFSGASNIAPAMFTFINISTDATTFVWEFGDNATSTEQNPQHTYTTGGSFTVKLTAIGQGGTNSTTKTINIQNPAGPTADFSFTGSGGTAPCLIRFENHCTNATSFVWDFGDGQSSTASNPSHSYSVGGNFSVRLIANSINGSANITKSISVLTSPTICKITKVTILSCSLTDGTGVGWDSFSAPDFYFNLETTANSIFLNGRTGHQTDNSIFPQSWNVSNCSIPGTSFNTSFRVHIWEYDSPDADDDVAIVNFKLSDYTSYPSDFTVTNGITQVKITVQWL